MKQEHKKERALIAMCMIGCIPLYYLFVSYLYWDLSWLNRFSGYGSIERFLHLFGLSLFTVFLMVVTSGFYCWLKEGEL